MLYIELLCCLFFIISHLYRPSTVSRIQMPTSEFELLSSVQNDLQTNKDESIKGTGIRLEFKKSDGVGWSVGVDTDISLASRVFMTPTVSLTHDT